MYVCAVGVKGSVVLVESGDTLWRVPSSRDLSCAFKAAVLIDVAAFLRTLLCVFESKGRISAFLTSPKKAALVVARSKIFPGLCDTLLFPEPKYAIIAAPEKILNKPRGLRRIFCSCQKSKIRERRENSAASFGASAGTDGNNGYRARQQHPAAMAAPSHPGWVFGCMRPPSFSNPHQQQQQHHRHQFPPFNSIANLFVNR